MDPAEGCAGKVGRPGQHVRKIEQPQDLLIETTRLILETVRQDGYTSTKKELPTMATMAKNTTTEFGGFSPLQAVIGRNPDLSAEDPH